VTDHADLLDSQDFQDAVIERWRGGNALIPEDWWKKVVLVRLNQMACSASASFFSDGRILTKKLPEAAPLIWYRDLCGSWPIESAEAPTNISNFQTRGHLCSSAKRSVGRMWIVRCSPDKLIRERTPWCRPDSPPIRHDAKRIRLITPPKALSSLGRKSDPLYTSGLTLAFSQYCPR